MVSELHSQGAAVTRNKAAHNVNGVTIAYAVLLDDGIVCPSIKYRNKIA